jgi:uncharacterized protein YcfL
MRAAHFGPLLAAVLLVGCGSHAEIPVGEQQTLVMESNVLAAGISADAPEVKASEIQATATSRLFNERQEPITVHYRFFWYDARGLEMHPLEPAQHHGACALFCHLVR